MNLAAFLPPPARQLADAILNAGGRAVVVGGAVRDHLLGLPPKDIDIEAYGLPIDALQAALRQVAKVHAVGKSFGVLKTRISGMEIDVSLPRRERKVGQGHRGFEVDYNPFMPFAEAASRRDFTINAIGVDLGDDRVLDPWGGRDDLAAGLIRHVSDAFDEDPLRVLRACQFAARFGFAIAPETVAKCRSLQGELATLSSERIWEECKKLLLKAPRPSLGVLALATTGALALLPELASTPEASNHRLRLLDACADLCRADGLDDSAALPLLLAALCHGLDEAASRALLARLGSPPTPAERCAILLREQSQPRQLWEFDSVQTVTDGTIRRLALRVPVKDLCRLALADFRARSVNGPPGPCPWTEWLERRAASACVFGQAPQPILQGRDLQALGVKPGPAMGVLLKHAFEAQLDGVFADRPAAIDWARRSAGIPAGIHTT